MLVQYHFNYSPHSYSNVTANLGFQYWHFNCCEIFLRCCSLILCARLKFLYFSINKVYAEHLLEPLLQTILGLAGPKTTILVYSSFSFTPKRINHKKNVFSLTVVSLQLGYEIRSTNVHDRMLDMWKSNFEVKIIPKSKVCPSHLSEFMSVSSLCLFMISEVDC